MRVRELRGHARAEATGFGRELSALFGWWLSVNFGLTCAVVGLFGTVWPAAVVRWNGLFVGMWLLAFSLCHCAGANARPLPRVLRMLSLTAGGISAVVGAYCVRSGARLGDTLAVVALCLATLAATDGASASRYGWRTWFAARAGVSLLASQFLGAFVLAGTVAPGPLSALAIATGVFETARGAYEGLRHDPTPYLRRAE